MKGLVIGVIVLAFLDVVVSSTSAAKRAGSVGTIAADALSSFLSPTRPGLTTKTKTKTSSGSTTKSGAGKTGATGAGTKTPWTTPKPLE